MDEIELSGCEKLRFDYIIEKFDFERVHNCMLGMSWKWYINGSFVTPNITDLKYLAKSLLKRMILRLRNDKNSFISSNSGGFQIFYIKELDKLELSFVVSYEDDLILIKYDNLYQTQKKIDNRKKIIKELIK